VQSAVKGLGSITVCAMDTRTPTSCHTEDRKASRQTGRQAQQQQQQYSSSRPKKRLAGSLLLRSFAVQVCWWRHV